MKQRQIELDNLPKPGEPLRPHVHEDNQRLLDEEIAERARRVQAKLKFWQVVRLRLRYNRLWKLLNQARYNPMVKERYQLLKTCTRLKYEAESADEDKRPA